MKQYYSAIEIAKMYGVTERAVGYWVKNGLGYKLQRVIGRKARRVFRVEDVNNFLDLGIKN